MKTKSTLTTDDFLPPQALQINEFTGLNFCQGVNISLIPPGVM